MFKAVCPKTCLDSIALRNLIGYSIQSKFMKIRAIWVKQWRLYMCEDPNVEFDVKTTTQFLNEENIEGLKDETNSSYSRQRWVEKFAQLSQSCS